MDTHIIRVGLEITLKAERNFTNNYANAINQKGKNIISRKKLNLLNTRYAQRNNVFLYRYLEQSCGTEPV